MRALRCGLVALLSLCALACTQQGAYEGLRQGQRNDCQSLPEAQAREHCLKDADVSYDDYRRQRQDVDRPH